jgi:hypothetical protein
MDNDLAGQLLGSITTDSLVVFAGAGLSMALPSRVPSAKALALACAAKYESQSGISLPSNIRDDLEELCKFLLARNQFYTLFLENIVEWGPFRRNPNKGHEAVADLLATKALRLGITTNFDVLVEAAAAHLGEDDFMPSLDAREAAIARPHQTFLKIHGCGVRDRANTLWCKEQLRGSTALPARIESCKSWLAGNLVGRDLVFVGFWSEWDHLTQVLESCVTSIEPRLVILVDPQPPDAMQRKAPNLWAWASDSRRQFRHVQESGAEFLDDLRRRFSVRLLEQIIEQAMPAYVAITGRTYARNPSFTTTLTTDDLYSLRRDFAGIPNTKVVRDKLPSTAMQVVATVHMRLLEQGALFVGSRYELASKRIRVVQGAGEVLSLVKKRFAEEVPAHTSDDFVICVGATDDGGAASHVVRSGAASTVVRPTDTAIWMTDGRAITELTI